MYHLYKDQATDYDTDFEEHLRYVYEGKDRKKFSWQAGDEWQPKLSLSLTQPADLDSFYVQGYTRAPKITEQGLVVETPNLPQSPANYEKQVYLWTWKTFEGDLYVEYEFKILRPGGLSLLMVQASGMNREDFMKDYPLRTTGNMRMVHQEDIRNYHWEYYREMNDVRNDIACGALAKNPYLYPLSFGCVDHLFEKDTWHKLQFLQRGDSLIGAIDGVVMVEAKDSALINNGAVYNYGHVAIRCMIRTKMMFRNLKIYNRNQAFEVQSTVK